MIKMKSGHFVSLHIFILVPSEKSHALRLDFQKIKLAHTRIPQNLTYAISQSIESMVKSVWKRTMFVAAFDTQTTTIPLILVVEKPTPQIQILRCT